MATAWLGYKPKGNVEKLIYDKEVLIRNTKAALVIQCALRRKFAYNVYKERRRWWLLNIVIVRTQATIRGYFQRKRFA